MKDKQSLRCGSATQRAHRLRASDRLHASTKHRHITCQAFVLLFYPIHFITKHILATLFLTDSFFSCTFKDPLLPHWAKFIIFSAYISRSRIPSIGLFYISTHSFTYLLWFYTDISFLFTMYRQRDWLNHFGHLGLCRGLTSRWIGYPSSMLLRGNESPYLIFAFFLDCWSWVDFSCSFPPTDSCTYIILIFVCLWITDHLSFVSYHHVYNSFLSIFVRIHSHSSISELSHCVPTRPRLSWD
jgi:hypothetical protein